MTEFKKGNTDPEPYVCTSKMKAGGGRHTQAIYPHNDCLAYDPRPEYDCTHPLNNVTWDIKENRTVLIVHGYIHGTCDLCDEKVFIPAVFK